MNKSIVLIAVLCCLNWSSVQAGGPWPQPKGKGFFKLSEWWMVFNKHYTDSGLIDPNLTTGIFSTTFYGEYGVTDRWTVIAYVPFFVRNFTNSQVSAVTNEVLIAGEAVNGFGDLELAAKYGLTKSGSRVPVAASLYLGIPTGIPVAGTLNNLQTGDGEFNQMLRVDAGTGFKLGEKVNSYASAYVGFNHRTKGFSEEFRFGAELGFGFLNQRLWVNGKLQGIESLKNGATAATANTTTSIFANNAEFVAYSIELAAYVTKNVGISASYAGAIRGEIIAAAPTYSVGIFYDMNK